MPDLPPAIYVPIAGSLIAGMGILAAAIRRLYGDKSALEAAHNEDYVTLAIRVVSAIERDSDAIRANTEAIRAIRDETLELYRTLVRTGRTSRVPKDPNQR